MSDPTQTIRPTRIAISALPLAMGRFRPQDVGGPSSAPVPPPPAAPTREVEIDAAYQRGHADGLAEAHAAMMAERTRLLALVASAEALRNEPSEELAQLIAETVERLVTQILGDVPIDGPQLRRRAEAAARLIGDCDAARTLWLHPDDMALIEQAPMGLTLMVDPKAEMGSIRIDCSAGWIEHGTALYLDALRAELGLKGTDA
ncbi:flagellar biosynthetic protein [Aquisediminimonas sediminicola]|uniref:FliH/SctL family protein n=1 Tax=Alteraquisediminimonas sediminicola TaxID=2676787 RepID=UPI001C8DDB88|nr:flagellar biosynthetic protein [Aquisediminimonas sediminicola]